MRESKEFKTECIGLWESLLLGEPGKEGCTYQLLGGDYIFRDGILRQKKTYSVEQSQTEEAFGFKWAKKNMYDTIDLFSFAKAWLVERYLAGDIALLEDYVPDGCRFLDAGCGGGYSIVPFLENKLNQINYLGVDISDSVNIAQQRFAERGLKGEFLQADFTQLPFDGHVFDVVFAEGTLHHTDCTEKSLKSLAKLLVPAGYFLFYIYRKKGPLREFCDDFIRYHLRDLTDEEVWQTLMPLTKLGKALGDLKVTIEVTEEIPFLGIPSGPIDLQRFFYWHVFKAFYRPDTAVDTLNLVNFDWYRPVNAHRHSVEEVKDWCREADLAILHIDVQESGVTVVGQKQP